MGDWRWGWRAFFRYLMPATGLSFLVAVIALTSSPPGWSAICSVVQTEGIGIPGGALILLLLAGIGYMASSAHHIVYSIGFGPFYPTVRHQWALEYAQRSQLLEVRIHSHGLGCRRLHSKKYVRLSRRGAWRVASAVWHEMMGESESARSAGERLVSLTDIMHGAGALLVGSWTTIGITIIIHFRQGPTTYLVHLGPWDTAFFLSAAAMVFLGYWKAVRNCEGYANAVILDQLHRRHANGNKTSCHAASSDLAATGCLAWPRQKLTPLVKKCARCRTGIEEVPVSKTTGLHDVEKDGEKSG